LPRGSNSVRRSRALLGTFVEIELAGAKPLALHAAIDEAFAAVAHVHRLMSFHDGASDVGRLNRAASGRPVRVHPWTFQVLEAAVDLHRQSGGLFDVAVAPVLEDLGLLPAHPSQPTVPSDCAELATTAAIDLRRDRTVCFRHGAMRIDLGGIAKGFAVDRAIEVLQARHGMPRGVVNAGGDLAAFGRNPVPVSIRDPRDPSRLLLALRLEGRALASSGHHFDPLVSMQTSGIAVIDPRMRTPVRNALAATVLAPSCMLADALTKVVMLAGPAAGPLLDHHRASALVVQADGRLRMTEDLQDAVCLAA
jgi:FAD:protein FMN transferase